MRPNHVCCASCVHTKLIVLLLFPFGICAANFLGLGFQFNTLSWWQMTQRRNYPNALVFKRETSVGVKYPPRFKYPNSMFKMDIKPTGSSIRIRCIAEGNPTPNITWFISSLKNMLISRPFEIQAVYNEWALYMKDLTKADAGNYTCLVCNELGCIQHTVTLKVIDRYPTKPFIMEGYPMNTTVSVHNTAQLSCPTFYGLVPHLYWIKPTKYVFKDPNVLLGIEPIPPGRIIKSQNAEDKADQLTLYNVTKADEGWYICVAMNTLGRSVGRAYLSVTDTPKSEIKTPTNNESLVTNLVAVDDKLSKSTEDGNFRVDLQQDYFKQTQDPPTNCDCSNNKDNELYRKLVRNELQKYIKGSIRKIIGDVLREKLSPLFETK